VQESQSLWLTIPIQADGTFGFTISPNTPGDDYDFALFGPNVDCNGLGPSIRCSYASPSASGDTGMSASASDASEDSGGDGFVSQLNARAGETYVLLIDNFSNNNQGFAIEWNGGAVIAGEPEINTPVVPPICDLGRDDLEPFDLSTLNSVISGGNSRINISYHQTRDDAVLGNNELDKNYIASDGDQVFIRGTFSDNGCATVTDFTFELITLPDDSQVSGPTSVCPDVSGISYQVTGNSGNTYQWLIEGGNITAGANSDQVTVDWLATNPDALLKVVPTSSAGCVGDTIRYEVVINTRLEPATPMGPTLVCLSAVTEATYSVPFSTGSVYDWTVVNGTLITANGSNEVTVRWNGDAPGQISFEESNPMITDCEGVSPVLDITFFPQVFADPVVTPVSCFGESTGAIALNPTGGTGTLAVTWADGATCTTRNNLPTGTYSYTVTDDNLCSINGTVTISQPDALMITDLSFGNLTCFENNSGFAEATVMGGTTPYTYTWSLNNNPLPLNGPDISGRAAGSYGLLVTDANGCTQSDSFVLTEPQLLEPDLSQLINQPICPQASDGAVTVGAKGGTPDYEFIWELSPVQTGATATGLSRGNYRVIIRDANGCETSQQVEVIEQFPRVFVPNAFTPNGDGENDVFGVKSSCTLNSFKLLIFNQWGNPVFATANVAAGWPGTISGQPVPGGNYAWALSYSFNVNGTLFSETIRGEVRVLR
jgi:gliding motility-associated-like protein